MGRYYYILILIIGLFLGNNSFARQCSSVASGNWSSGSTWSCGTPPTCGDTLTVTAGTIVSVSQQEDYSACVDAMFIIVEGTLDFASGKKLTLPLGSGILVLTGGEVIGAGGGKANIIDIGGTSVWTSSDGNITTPIVLGEPFISDVVSIASGNWSNTATWDCACVPDSLNNVTVVAGHSVVLDGNNSVRNLIINGTFSASGSVTLDVAGDWDNQGTYTNGTETIRFDGGVAQNILGAAAQTFTNITIAQGSSVTNATGTITLLGNLLFESGSFDCANNFVLRSDASGTGNIGDLTNGTFTGNIIYERMVPSGATSWRFFSSALAGQTISGWDDDFITSGFTGSNYPSFPFTSIYTYDETVLDVKDSGFVPVVSIADNLTPGKGFWVWAGDNSSGTSAFTVDLAGAINQGAISFPVSFTSTGVVSDDGWNMVGNPYPCALDWDAVGWTKTNIDNAVYIWDPNTGAYASYVAGVGNNGGSNIIASGQAFWVKAFAAAPVLTAFENTKSVSLADPFKSYNAPSYLRLSITNNDSTSKDETTFNVVSTATQLYDGGFDAVKMKSEYAGALYLSSKTPDGQDLSINSFSPEFDTEIPVVVKVPVSGQYTFSVSDFGGLNEMSCVHLRNEQTGELLEVVDSLVVVQYVPATNAPVHRFTLLLSAKNSVSYNQPSCSQVEDAEIELRVNGEGVWEVNCIDQNSLENYTASVVSDTMVLLEGLPSGSYEIAVADSSICPLRISTVVIPESDSTLAVFNSEVLEFTLLDDHTLTVLNESVNADAYEWSFGDGYVTQEMSVEHHYQSPGKYVVQLIASKNEVCKDTMIKEVTVLDVPFDNPAGLDVHLFPNSISAGESVMLHISENIEEVTVKLFSINGKLLLDENIALNGTSMVLDLMDVPPALYILNVVIKDEIFPFKLTIK